jgi:L-asparagine oxygenase
MVSRPLIEYLVMNRTSIEFSYTSEFSVRNGMPQRWIELSDLEAARFGAEFTYELSAGERGSLSAVLSDFEDAHSELRFSELVARAHDVLKRTAIFQKVRAIREPSSPGFFLLRNLPVVDPAERLSPNGTNERLLLSAVAALGFPFGFEAWNRSEIVHSIEPKADAANQQLGDGNVDLLWHVEDAHTPLAPDFFALLCVRGDDTVRTFVRKIDVRELGSKTIALLSDEAFLIEADESFRDRCEARAAVLSTRPDGGLAVRYDPFYTRCATSEHLAALDELTRQLAHGAVAVVLRPGDVLVVDNRQAVHGRSSYTPRFDGRDRLLRKVFIRNEPIPPSDAANSSPFLVSTRASGGSIDRPELQASRGVTSC